MVLIWSGWTQCFGSDSEELSTPAATWILRHFPSALVRRFHMPGLPNHMTSSCPATCACMESKLLKVKLSL